MSDNKPLLRTTLGEMVKGCEGGDPAGAARFRRAEALGRGLLIDVPWQHRVLPPAPDEAWPIVWLLERKEQVWEVVEDGWPRAIIFTLAEARDLLGACGSPVSTLEEAARVLQTPAPQSECRQAPPEAHHGS